MANPLVLSGYPAPPGSKKETVVDVTGPASYTQISLGTTITGGQALTARQLGISGLIEDVTQTMDGYDTFGNIYAVRRFLVPLVAVGSGKGGSKIVLQWLKNGTEITTGQSAAFNIRLLIRSTSY